MAKFPPVLTTGQAATLANRSKRTIDYWVLVRYPHLIAYNLPCAKLIDAEAFIAFLRNDAPKVRGINKPRLGKHEPNPNAFATSRGWRKKRRAEPVAIATGEAGNVSD